MTYPLYTLKVCIIGIYNKIIYTFGKVSKSDLEELLSPLSSQENPLLLCTGSDEESNIYL